MPQRHGGHDLGNLLERARATREGDERITEFDHLGLTLGHIARHDEVVDAVMLELRLDKKARLNPRHVAAGIEHAIGERTHQARLGPAVYQCVAVGANPCAELSHRGQKRRVVTDAGAQVYRDIQYSVPLVVTRDARSNVGAGDIRARGATGRRAHRDRALPNAPSRP